MNVVPQIKRGPKRKVGHVIYRTPFWPTFAFSVCRHGTVDVSAKTAENYARFSWWNSRNFVAKETRISRKCTLWIIIILNVWKMLIFIPVTQAGTHGRALKMQDQKIEVLYFQTYICRFWSYLVPRLPVLYFQLTLVDDIAKTSRL